MSDYKESAARRRDLRHMKDPVEIAPTAAKRKDTKRWCRGKVGVEHRPKCGPMTRYFPYLAEWHEYCCTACGKRLASWSGRGAKPTWVV